MELTRIFSALSPKKIVITEDIIHKPTQINTDCQQEEYEVVEREILPAQIVCPDCGGITLEGLEFCDKCGGELNN